MASVHILHNKLIVLCICCSSQRACCALSIRRRLGTSIVTLALFRLPASLTYRLLLLLLLTSAPAAAATSSVCQRQPLHSHRAAVNDDNFKEAATSAQLIGSSCVARCIDVRSAALHCGKKRRFGAAIYGTGPQYSRSDNSRDTAVC
jgi:hypothetical protein